jgi:hypothetical protein
MSDAGQGMFADPSTALTFATTPDQLLAGQDTASIYGQSVADEQARQQRAGAMQQIMGGLGTAWHAVDGALSNVPGWGVTKNITHAVVVTPLDKLASGAYWLYSNYVSQPLSTALLMGGKADIYGGGTFFSGDQWSDAWHKAEHISPGQAAYNVQRTVTSDESDTPGIPDTGNLNMQQKQQLERFLYDSDYWRNRDGWKYTVGTGTMDFMANIADPIGGAAAGLAKGVKAARSLQAAEAAAPLPTMGQAFAKGGVSGLAETAAQKIFPGPKSAAEISASDRMNKAFDWMSNAGNDNLGNKSAFEIAQHPMWGTGRRAIQERFALSEILSQASRDEMPLIWRFAQGDNKALQELSAGSQDLVAQIGKAQDNRTLLAGHTWDEDILDAYVQNRIAGKAEAPMEAAYGLTPTQQSLYSDAADAVMQKRIQSNYTPTTWVNRAKTWQAGQVQAADAVVQGLMARESWYGKALGDNLGQPLDQVTPTGSASLFGTAKQAYRMGPLAMKDTENAADAAIKAATRDRDAYEATGSNLITRTLQRGFYGIPLRVYQSFGDRIPQGFVDHNADDAMDRVNDMLKQVPGLGQQNRLDLINQYANAGDKIARSVALDSIQKQVIQHMVGQYNLNDDVAQFASDLITDGWQKSMFELTGRTPTSSRFTAAQQASGKYLDTLDDGYGHRVAPLLKSQLSASDPLLDVDQLDKILSRNSGHFSLLTSNGGKVFDNIKTFADGFNGMWKASTLLRAGYALRAPSEEMVAGAVKFGLLSAMTDAGKGGMNWIRNRPQAMKAMIGRGGFDITDPDLVKFAKDNNLPTENIQVHKAFPFVQKYLGDNRDKLNDLETQMRQIDSKAKKTTDQDALDQLSLQKQDLQDQHDDVSGVVQEFTNYANEMLRKAAEPTRARLGTGTFTYKGQEVPQPFNEQWAGAIPRDQITSEEAMGSIFARAEAIERARLIKTGSWTSVTPDMPNYMESWTNAINKQLGNDPVAQMLMKDPTGDTAMQFLKSQAGRAHMTNMTRQAQDPKRLVGIINAMLDQYIPKGTGLRDKLLAGNDISEADLRGAIRPEDFPLVHGEDLAAMTGDKKSVSKVIDGIIEKGFKYLGTIPSDIMSRQPIYIRAHAAHMRDLMDRELSYRAENGMDQTIDPDTMNKMMGVADKRARNTLSQIVYDPERTTATQALRFVAPFMAAHIDGLERWFGLVAEKPELLNTASKIYNAPVAAHLVTDQNGNVVDEDGYVTHRDANGNITGKTFVGQTDRYINLKIPGTTRNLRGVTGGVPEGGISLPIQSLNTILPGDPWWNPGTGPLVQIAGSKIAEQSPGMGDFLQWAKVLPYGPQGIMDSITPAYMKTLWSAYQGDDPNNTKFQQTLLEEYQRQQADYANGGPEPDFKAAVANAKQFTFLKALTQFASPTSVTTSPLQGTPYQFFVDQYKQLQQLNPKTASQVFLKTYGADYYGFTAALNKSIGINSTNSAVETAAKYKDLIGEHPELASLIVGPYNGGAFSQTANKMLQDMNFAGTPGKAKMTAYDAVDNNDKALGWEQYKQYAGMVDAGLIRAGFHSYTDPGAAQFQLIKQAIIQHIGDQYPAWEQDFNTTDKNAVPRKIDAMKQIVQDESLMSDPMRTDLQTLQLYLQARDAIQAQLLQRPNTSLTARDANGQLANHDLAQAWGAVQLGLVQSDTKFNDLFNRYLANDQLQFGIEGQMTKTNQKIKGTRK